MRYIKFTASTPYCGTDNERYVAFSDDATNQDVEEYADDLARENGEGFEYLVFGWDADPVGDGEMTEEEYDEAIDNYYADCHCEYEDVSEEEFMENGGVDA